MNLSALKTRAWWALKDNSANPQKIDATTLVSVLNDALQDLAYDMQIIKSGTLTFSNGVASLPNDFLQVVAVYDGDSLLEQIEDITDKVDDSDTTSQFFIPNLTQIYIYGTTPTGTVTLWYYATPAALANDSDTPSNLPERFHRYLATVWVKKEVEFRNNQLADFSTLEDYWENVVKPKVRVACLHDRNYVARHSVDTEVESW